MRRPESAHGFTVIELMTVILIIGIVSAVAIPMGLNYIRNYEVLGAAQSVAAQVQRSRAEAVRRNVRRGILLNFNYPEAGQYQFTTLEENPVTGGWAAGTPFHQDPGPWDPNAAQYGFVPIPPQNVATYGGGLPSPHGPVNVLPAQLDFVGGGPFDSLLFRSDGSVEAVDVANWDSGGAVGVDNLDWVVTIRNRENGLQRRIRVSRNGRVIVEP